MMQTWAGRKRWGHRLGRGAQVVVNSGLADQGQWGAGMRQPCSLAARALEAAGRWLYASRQATCSRVRQRRPDDDCPSIALCTPCAS